MQNRGLAPALPYIVLILLIGGFLWWHSSRDETTAPVAVNSFEECAALYPVLESYPEQCNTPEGQHFVRDIGNELEKMDLIRIDAPRPNASITSPLVIGGEARGYWYFEASFPIELRDANGNILAQHYATAQGEWMTEEFVPYKAELTFATPTTATGTLILRKDNPSGLPENDDALTVPVRF